MNSSNESLSTHGVVTAGECTGRKPRVLVLMGGPDAEREVSIMSGTEVAKALESSGEFEVVLRTVMRPGA